MKPLFIPTEELNILIHQLSEKYIRLFFGPTKKQISGQEIFHFCDHQQVNRFLFFQLHQDWNQYQTGLRHPFYNFQHEEVKKALQSYLNTVSAHILLTEKDVRPLVEKAVYNTITLLLNPEETLTAFYFSTKESINLSLLEKNASYFDYFDFLLQGIVLFHQQNHMPLVRRRVFLEKLIRAEEISNQRGKSLEQYRRELFRQLTGQDLFEVARTADGTIPMPELPEATVSEETKSTQVSRTLTAEPEPPVVKEGLFSETVSQTNNTTIAQDTIQPENKNTETTTEPHPEPLPTPTFVKEDPTPSVVTPAQPSGLNDVSASVAEVLSQKQTASDSISQKLFKSITIDKIPIHKQFQFSQKIFLGNTAEFKLFIENINKTQNWEEAQSLISSLTNAQSTLKEEDPLLIEFIEIIKNRYQS